MSKTFFYFHAKFGRVSIKFEQNSQVILDFRSNKYNQQTRWFLCGSNGSKMGSTGSNSLIGFNWDNSTVGVGNESSISVGITVNSDGVDDTTGSSVSNLGSIDSWLINRDNSSVSMGNK